MNADFAADAENGHDVRMMQLRRGLRLDLEPLPLLWINRRGERQYFESNVPAQRNLLGLIDDTHTPTPDLAQDSIFAQLSAGWNRIVEMGQGKLRIGKLRDSGLDELQPGKTLSQCLGDI